jgi:predicted metal-binding membrane protein
MKSATLKIIIFLISLSVLTWLVSIWQYDTMMSSMMTFYHSPTLLSLFVIIWTAGMAAMMFPAIIPMILVYNRLIDNKNDKSNSENRRLIKENENKRNVSVIYSLRYALQSKSYHITLFVSSYLAIWALTGIALLVGWSFVLNSLLLQLGMNDSQQQLEQQEQQVSINTIYGIVLIISGIYQFSSLKTRCLGYCESPLSFFMRRWRKGILGAIKMGSYHGLYCLGCCWPYFLLMVALGWMNVLWMGLFAAIIFAEKIWSKGGLWIARTTGIGFITIGILSSIGIISLPSDSMTNSDRDSNMMSMDMSSSSSDGMTSHDGGAENGSDNSVDADNNSGSRDDMKDMIMGMYMIVL